MAWFKVDDKLADHRKVRRLGTDKLAAMGLWTLCGSWAADELSDGFVPEEIARRFDPGLECAGRLVEVGLWDPAEQDGETGFQFHEWTDHQPSKDQVLERRRADADRRARWRDAKRNGAARPGPEAGRSTGQPDVSQRDSRVESQQESRRDTPRESQQGSRPGSVLPVPARPDPSLSSPKPSPRNSRSLLAEAGIDDEREIDKILETVQAENPGIRNEVAYVARLIDNGDLPAVRRRAAQVAAGGQRSARAQAFIDANRHDFDVKDRARDPDGCKHCRLPERHPIHQPPAAATGGDAA
jgi:hypothetical protein